jgi:PAS domain S-box-containing protein
MNEETNNLIKILFIEDNLIDQLAYKQSLKKLAFDFEYKMVDSVAKATELIAVEHFDVAVVDYQLEDGTGLEVLPKLNDTLIIFVTGEGDLSIAVKAMKLGVFDFLVKDAKKEYLDLLHQVITNGVDKIKSKQNLAYAEEKINRLSTALSQVNNSIAIVNVKGEFVWVNDFFNKLTGYSLENLKLLPNEDLKDLSVCGLLPNSREYQQVINTKEAISFEHKNKTKKGEEYYVITTLTPLLNLSGEITEVMAVEVDISKQKKNENDLLNAKLEAESSVRAKEQFLANMSHEIRTPMNAILGMSQLLADTRISGAQKKYLNVIYDSSNNLLTIINDILDYSKINAGKIDIENVTFNLPRSLRDIKNSFSLRNANTDVKMIFSIDSHIPRLVMGDSVRIKQILNNLLSNSFKFTSNGAIEVDVKLVGVGKTKTWIEFSVKDSGIGISQEALPNIFDKFTQANASITRSFGGTGLGLSIVKKLVQLMNGHITIDSELGKGTIVRVVIPLNTPENLKAPVDRSYANSKMYSRQENLKKINILLVEDNKMNQMLAIQYLGKQGAKVTLCENGKDAYEKYLSGHYDIILMDLQMPVMGGLEATDLIRKSEKDKEVRIPILAMTAHALQGDRDNCLSHGMDDYIAKPIKLSELQHKIISLISGGSLNGPISVSA